MAKLLSIGTDRKLFEEGSAVERRFLEYGKAWEEIHVVVASDTRFSERRIGSNVYAYPTRSAVKALYPFDAVKIGASLIRAHGITDITCQDPFLTALAGVRLKERFGPTLEIQVHTDIGSPYFARGLADRFRLAMAKSQLPKADKVRVVSERVKRYLVRELGIPAEKISVRPIAVDAEAIRRAPTLPGADLHARYPKFRKVALMASRLTKEKDIALALRAWKDVVARAPDAGLVIVGAGPERPTLERLARILGIERAVAFEPWADLPTLYSYYKTADLLLVTSLYEGYGMTLAEAHAAGCPIVSTDVGIAPEIGAAIVSRHHADVARGIAAALGV